MLWPDGDRRSLRLGSLLICGLTRVNIPDTGLRWGAALTPYIPLLVQPSLELRVTSDGGSIAAERTFSGGLKLAVRLGHIHPYGIAEIGLGEIYFDHPTVNPNGTLYARDGSRMLR